MRQVIYVPGLAASRRPDGAERSRARSGRVSQETI